MHFYKRFAYTVAILVLFSMPLAAQPGSVIKQLFSGASTVPQTFEVPNFGQPSHEVFLQMANAVGHNCFVGSNSTVVAAQMEGSFDETNWIAFGTPLIGNGNGASRSLNGSGNGFVYLGSGIFNYVRFRLTSFDTTDCTATATYVGIPNVSILEQVQGPAAVGSTFDKMTQAAHSPVLNPMPMAGWGGGSSSTFNPGSVVPYAQCYGASTGTATAASNVEFQLGGPTGDYAICGITVTLTAAGTVTFYESAGADCTTNSGTLIPAMTLATGTPLQIGASTFGVLFVTGGNAVSPIRFCMAATGGNATAVVYYMQAG